MTNEELVLEYQHGNNNALNELIENNKGIVYKIANKFKITNNSIDKDDLIQEGMLGLIIAADKYNFEKENKAKFITYAINWIYEKIYNTVIGHSTREKYNTELNNNCTSLNSPIGKDEKGELQDIIINYDNEIVNIDEILMLRELRKDLNNAMLEYNTLTEREVLKLYYGWDTSQMTFREIAELYNKDLNFIKSIKNKALNKLRNSKYIRDNKNIFMADGLIDYPRFII